MADRRGSAKHSPTRHRMPLSVPAPVGGGRTGSVGERSAPHLARMGVPRAPHGGSRQSQPDPKAMQARGTAEGLHGKMPGRCRAARPRPCRQVQGGRRPAACRKTRLLQRRTAAGRGRGAWLLAPLRWHHRDPYGTSTRVASQPRGAPTTLHRAQADQKLYSRHGRVARW